VEQPGRVGRVVGNSAGALRKWRIRASTHRRQPLIRRHCSGRGRARTSLRSSCHDRGGHNAGSLHCFKMDSPETDFAHRSRDTVSVDRCAGRALAAPRWRRTASQPRRPPAPRTPASSGPPWSREDFARLPHFTALVALNCQSQRARVNEVRFGGQVQTKFEVLIRGLRWSQGLLCLESDQLGASNLDLDPMV
jgi:hypothetical protein